MGYALSLVTLGIDAEAELHALEAESVIGLVVAVRDDELRDASADGLGESADAAGMNESRAARQDPAEGQVGEGLDVGWEIGW